MGWRRVARLAARACPRAGSRSGSGRSGLVRHPAWCPTSVRTMRRMNASASIQNSSACSPASSHSARRMLRSKRTCSVSVGVKAVKSCVPSSAAAHASQRGAVERVRPVQRAPVLERAGRLAREQAVAVGAAQGVTARVEALPRRLALEHPHVAGSTPLRARAGAGSPSWLATWPRACTPASVRPATVSRTSRAQHPGQRLLQLALHRPQPGCRAQPANPQPSYSSSSRGWSLAALARDDDEVLVVDRDAAVAGLVELLDHRQHVLLHRGAILVGHRPRSRPPSARRGG